MFQILALNCLVSAYGLSVLHLRGVRMGDTQATATGIATALFFLFVSLQGVGIFCGTLRFGFLTAWLLFRLGVFPRNKYFGFALSLFPSLFF